MSDTTSSPTTTTSATPVCVQGSFFFSNVPSIASAMDVQTSLTNAYALLAQALPNAQQAVTDAQQAVTNANYFLSGDLRGLPTSPDGLAVGATWNNGGSIALVTA